MIDFTADDLNDVKQHYEEVVREIKQAMCFEGPVKRSNDSDDDDQHDENDYLTATGVTIETEPDETHLF